MDERQQARHDPTVPNTDSKWYRRFAEVPGVEYEGDLQLRSSLPARDVVPTVNRYRFEGRTIVSLSWPTSSGSSSASPAHEVAFGSWSEESDMIRERVLSALELPGQLSDYHFALQGAAEVLWRRRREEPWQLDFVERLSWLDVRLVDSHPHVIEIEPGKKQYVRVLAFERIVGLYEQEGFLREALAAAERFARFCQNSDTVCDLRARVARLREEHA